MIVKNIIKNMILSCGFTILTQEKTLARLNARGWCQTTLNEKCEPIKVL